jgi:hypothetical protein
MKHAPLTLHEIPPFREQRREEASLAVLPESVPNLYVDHVLPIIKNMLKRLNKRVNKFLVEVGRSSWLGKDTIVLSSWCGSLRFIVNH